MPSCPLLAVTAVKLYRDEDGDSQQQELLAIVHVDVQSSLPGQRGQGELHVQLIYKPFEDEEEETNSTAYQQAESFAAAAQDRTITDVRSAAGWRRHLSQMFKALSASFYNSQSQAML